ncbi:unnamed protein product [marine sediment metagenome]|uniref:Uncharacterized protein n=1 Tax=marine sediment metagenome TaxID=412755 RepID=X1DQ66_9ZZZZ
MLPVNGEKTMSRIEGVVISARRTEREGGRTYIIRYRIGKGEHEIRVRENTDTDVSFYPGNKIEIETHGNTITITNYIISGRVTGTKVS